MKFHADHEFTGITLAEYERLHFDEEFNIALCKAVKLARTPEEVVEEDLDVLRTHGFDDEDIWDIGAITALFALSNRMAQLTGMEPNDEFFLLGRVPRS